MSVDGINAEFELIQRITQRVLQVLGGRAPGLQLPQCCGEVRTDPVVHVAQDAAALGHPLLLARQLLKPAVALGQLGLARRQALPDEEVEQPAARPVNLAKNRLKAALRPGRHIVGLRPCLTRLLAWC